MKKIFLALLIFGAVILAPIAKADTVMMGDAYTSQIAPMEQIAQLQAQLISLITQLIGILQQQLNTINAQNQVAQNTPPAVAAPAPAQVEAPIQKTVEPFIFTPIVKNYYNQSLVTVISEKFDRCSIQITDENGHLVDNSTHWEIDTDGNSRHVYSMGTKGQHTYSITCSKGGFLDTTKTGNYPIAE